MRYLSGIFIAIILGGCTLSVNMFHTEGSTDTFDENQTADPTVSPTLSVPVSTIPALPKMPGLRKD